MPIQLNSFPSDNLNDSEELETLPPGYLPSSSNK